MMKLRDPRWRWLAALIAIGLIAGVTGGTVAAFSSTTSNSANSFGVKADYEGPPLVRSEIARTTATAGGRIKANVAYFVYAQITDGGNPASGVNTATTNVCNITTATCASVTLTSGSYTVSGLSYNYRTASKTSDVGLTAGSKTYSVTAVDVATNSSGAVNFSVVVDATAPGGSNVQSANASGGTVGLPETNDTLTFTFGEAMDPASLKALWDGTSTAVTVNLANAGCGGNDTLNLTGVNLGSLCLAGNYVNGNKSFTSSTIVMSGGYTVVTITLGTPSGAFNTEATAGTMIWTPSALATDVAGNAGTTTAVNEVTPPADVEF
jgi:hypothetical protein